MLNDRLWLFYRQAAEIIFISFKYISCLVLQNDKMTD